MQSEQLLTHNLTGELFIGQRRIEGDGDEFRAFNPESGIALEPSFRAASPDQIDDAVCLAEYAFDIYRTTTGERRALFLESIAEGIDTLGDSLLALTSQETGLPLARLKGERSRTTSQLRLFASLARRECWQNPMEAHSTSGTQSSSGANLRTRFVPIGPAAVFGASNFPYAFSVAGGDTAAALAVGCPVVVKAHPAHPRTSELIAGVVQTAAKKCGMPEGVFSMIAGSGNHVGGQLVSHPGIQAVAFTGSRLGGVALCKLAQQRPQPIPVYAEMSAINPVFILPNAIRRNAAQIATGFVCSLALGAGQFCTNPGVVIAVESDALQAFRDAVVIEVGSQAAQVMLSASILAGYRKAVKLLSDTDGVIAVSTGKPPEGVEAAQVNVFEVSAETFIENKLLHEEIFGPCALLVSCTDLAQMLKIAKILEGQLTATLHLTNDDLDAAKCLLPILERKAGRILVNDFPTGVAVADEMVHGGPFPATSDARSTSVGSRAVERFLRPICYQNFPENLLPTGLR
jgi:2,5-dioxopentanoate dehydrogenase